MNRDWTYKEIQSLILLRKSRKTVKECGRILGRSRFSVRQQLHRMKVVIQPKRQLGKQIKKLVKCGKTDTYISLKLKCSKHSVIYWRKKFNLKANKLRKHNRRARCFGCNKLSPLVISNGWAEMCGWVVEILNEHNHIAFCKTCAPNRVLV